MWLIIFLFVAFLYTYMIGDFIDDNYDGWVNRTLNNKEK